MTTCTGKPIHLMRWMLVMWLWLVVVKCDSCQFSSHASNAMTINMTSCILAAIDPAQLTTFSDLQTLTLSRNSLTTFPDLSPIASTLRVLRLGVNQIARMNNNSNLNLNNLEELYLESNSLTFFPDLTQIGGITLKKLALSYNQIADISTDVLGPLTSLEWLDLSGNSLTSFPDFSPLSGSLIFLNLHRNPIREISHGKLVTLVNLQELYLYNTDAVFTYFSHPVDGLRNLSYLNIRNTGLAHLPPIINDNVANIFMHLRGSVDVCRCDNAWLKQEGPKMRKIWYDDKECDGNLWSTITVNEMNAKCAQDRNQKRMDVGHAKAAKTMMSLKPILLNSYEHMAKKIHCTVKCLETPGCVSFYWRRLQDRRGDCVLMAPGNSISVSSVPSGNLQVWTYFALT